jgi:RNA polymerase sigma-70 factor (ECF subfamily)
MDARGSALALPHPGGGFAACNPFAAQPVLFGETTLGMQTASDEALAARVAQGDREAFAELHRRYQRAIFNFILRSVGQRPLAEELLQEAFMRVWFAGRTFDPTRGAFRPWLYRVALNTVRSEMVKTRYAAEHVPIEDVEGWTRGMQTPVDPDAHLDLSQQARVLARALDSLPPYLREVVVLRCYQQLKFAEISEITGAPEGTLKARFHRAVAALRARLGAPER